MAVTTRSVKLPIHDNVKSPWASYSWWDGYQVPKKSMRIISQGKYYLFKGASSYKFSQIKTFDFWFLKKEIQYTVIQIIQNVL